MRQNCLNFTLWEQKCRQKAYHQNGCSERWNLSNALDVLLVKQSTFLVSFVLFKSFAHVFCDWCSDKVWGFFWKLDAKWVENEISSEESLLVAEKAVRQYFNSLFRILLFELYSTDQIPLCLIRIFSITSYFLVNNLHFITYSNRIIQYQKIHMKLNATDSELCT